MIGWFIKYDQVRIMDKLHAQKEFTQLARTNVVTLKNAVRVRVKLCHN